MSISINMNEVLNAIMAKMKSLKWVIIDVQTEQQAMEDNIFSLESNKVERGRVEEMEVEHKIQAFQVQLEVTAFDVVESNRIHLQV